MRPMKIFFLTGLLGWICVADLPAQSIRGISPGARVRVKSASLGSKRLVGTFEKLHADTLILSVKTQKTPVLIPLRSVDQLEVSQGRKSRVRDGLFIGGLVGVGAGIVAYGIALQDEAADPSNPTETEKAHSAQFGIAVGLAVGVSAALLGGLIGFSIQTEQWQSVPIRKARLGLKSYRDRGLIFSVSLSF